jgi:spore germination cell wall hydrolase CwlJ-like protein
MKIRAKNSTKLKTKPEDSSSLKMSEFVVVPKNQELEGEIVKGENGHDYLQLFLWPGDWEYTKNTQGRFSHSEDDVDTMARTLWGEARGEDYEGRVAVAWVIKNRALKSPAYNWPSSVKGVCLQKWQFSCWNPTDPNRAKMVNLTEIDSMFKECLRIAASVLNGDIDDPTKESDHYHASSISAPTWAQGKKPTTTIGNHRFFNLIG